MESFAPKKFDLKTLEGISEKTIVTHLKLYEGYVKNANLILEHIEELAKDAEKYAYELGELQRRFSFEFGGMRNHERYFSSLESGSEPLLDDAALMEALKKEWGSFGRFENRFKAIALTRGIGWAMLYFDKETKRLLTQWVDEQHIGHLPTCDIIVALDMWEHSYILDYAPAEKSKYVEAFFKNLNWVAVNNWFERSSAA